MKKRLAALLSLMLVVTLVLSVPVFATGDEDTDDTTLTDTNDEAGEPQENDEPQETDEPQENEPVAFPFEDVAEDAYFYNSVKAVYELGLIKGMSDTTFGPAGNLTIAQAVVFAVRMHVYFSEDAVEPQNAAEGNWYDTYVAYAVEAGIIAEDTFEDYAANVTRAQMAFLFVKAVPAMTVVNETAAAPDAEGNEYAEYINTFYQAGILQGVDAEGNYNPDNAIVRRDIATIIFRLVDETQRIVPEVTDTEDAGDAETEDGTDADADGETEEPGDAETEEPGDTEGDTEGDAE